MAISTVLDQQLDHLTGDPTADAEIKTILTAASVLSGTESGYIDGVTAGTATANKAVVLGASKEIATITTATITNLTTTALTIGATAVTATSAELNDAADLSAQDKMAPSSVIDALIEQYYSCVKRDGGLIKTQILIDLTGAKSTTTDLDVIGNTGACHFGQITTAINGVIVAGQVTCLEVPATGADDIDFYSSTAADGAYDADASGLAGAAALLTKGGAWAAAVPTAGTAMTALPAANSYLYLACGEAGTVGTYTAGKFLIELWGLPA